MSIRMDGSRIRIRGYGTTARFQPIAVLWRACILMEPRLVSSLGMPEEKRRMQSRRWPLLRFRSAPITKCPRCYPGPKWTSSFKPSRKALVELLKPGLIPLRFMAPMAISFISFIRRSRISAVTNMVKIFLYSASGLFKRLKKCCQRECRSL